MSQKKEKYARCVERSLSGLEERLGCMQADQVERLGRLEAVQVDQSELIRQVLRERTAAEDTASRRISGMRRRAAAAERRAELWRCIALAAMLALLVICLAVVLWEPAGTAVAAAEDTAPGQADSTPRSSAPAPDTGMADADAEAEAAPAEVRVIRDCTVSYYCCERYPHICGTGDGITATGTEARPWITCAVDPTVIPLGSTVTVDIGDGETVECIAEDVGAWVQGEHMDICVSGHQEALELGIRRAEVRWEERP